MLNILNCYEKKSIKRFDNCYAIHIKKKKKTEFCVIVSLLLCGQVLQQQTEAIARLGSVLKRDIRDMEIMMAEDSGTTENGNSF